MIVCQTLAQAAAVPNVVLIVASIPPVAYQQGDVIPVGAIADNAAANTKLAGLDAQINAASLGSVQLQTIPRMVRRQFHHGSAGNHAAEGHFAGPDSQSFLTALARIR